MSRYFTQTEMRDALEDAVKEGWLRKEWSDKHGDWSFIDALLDLPSIFNVADVATLKGCSYSRANRMVYIWLQREIAVKIKDAVPSRRQQAQYSLKRSVRASK